MRRRKLRWVAGLTLAVLATGLLVAWPRSAPLTRENYYRVEKGMTLAEVEAILGPPNLAGAKAAKWCDDTLPDRDAWNTNGYDFEEWGAIYKWGSRDKLGDRLWVRDSE
jgi:hypothetical protein